MLSRRTFLKGSALGAIGAVSLGTAGALAGCAPNGAEQSEEAQGSTYTAAYKGCHGDVTVTATIKDGAISEIAAEGPLETPSIGGLALQTLPQKIAEAGSLSVDTVSGATITSTAIIKAAALCLTQAGVPVELAPERQSFKAGTYTATSRGLNGPVGIEVTFGADSIEEIALTESEDTPHLIKGAFDNTRKQVLETQSLAVDSVTSATYSFRAVLKGIDDCVSQAGGDPEKLKVPVLSNPAPAADEEMDADIVIVGGGTSGSIALYRLASQGVKAVCLESAPVLGGMGEIAGFSKMLWIGSRLQREAFNLSDEDVAALVDKKVKDFFEPIICYGDQHLIYNCASHCGEMVDMLQDAGMEMSPVDVEAVKITGRGTRWQSLFEKAAALGSQTLVSHRVDELIAADDGSISGVVATRPDGSHLTVHCKAVIISSGGACGNREMMERYYPEYAEKMENCAIPQADGAAIEAAWAVNAAKGMFGVHAHNHVMPFAAELAGVSMATSHIATAANTPLLWLNRQGRRFSNEECCYGSTKGGNAIYFAKCAYNVFDQAVVDTFSSEGSAIKPWRGSQPGTPLTDLVEELEEGVSKGWAFKSDTLEGLAEACGWDTQAAKEEIERYNQMVEAKDDVDYGRTPESLVYPVSTPPFYAIEIHPRCLGTFGGIVVTKDYEVVDDTGFPIKGLYAAGDVAAGWFGKFYLNAGGATSFHNTTSGYVAANSVLKFLGK